LTGQQTLIARTAIGALAGVASLAACSSARLRQLPARNFDRFVSSAFVLSRLLFFALIFLVLRIAPRGDIPAYYFPEAISVLRGLLPYRDFPSSYAPLHPYLDSLPLLLWQSPVAIILLAILAESLLLPLWLRFGRTILAESELRTGALLYLTSAVSLQFVAVDGQDNAIIALLLALSLFLLARSRALLAGVSTGVAISAVKFLPLVYVPAFFFTLTRRWRWIAGLGLTLAAIYGGALALRLPIFVPLQQEADIKSAGNLPFLIESLLGASLSSRLWDLILLLALAFVFYRTASAARSAPPAVRLRVLTFALAATTLALVSFSKKSWPPYLMLSLFPIALVIDGRRRLQVTGFALLGLVAVVEHSVWSTLLHQLTAFELHQGLRSGDPTCFVLLTLQVILIAGYVVLLAASLRRIASSPAAAPTAAPPPMALSSPSRLVSQS
jgi:Glycosyltransferase family 87